MGRCSRCRLPSLTLVDKRMKKTINIVVLSLDFATDRFFDTETVAKDIIARRSQERAASSPSLEAPRPPIHQTPGTPRTTATQSVPSPQSSPSSSRGAHLALVAIESNGAQDVAVQGLGFGRVDGTHEVVGLERVVPTPTWPNLVDIAPNGRGGRLRPDVISSYGRPDYNPHSVT